MVSKLIEVGGRLLIHPFVKQDKNHSPLRRLSYPILARNVLSPCWFRLSKN